MVSQRYKTRNMLASWLASISFGVCLLECTPSPADALRMQGFGGDRPRVAFKPIRRKVTYGVSPAVLSKYVTDPKAAWEMVRVKQGGDDPKQLREIGPGNMFAGMAPKPHGTLRFVFISDTHNRHNSMTAAIPDGDVLVHTGDFSNAGTLSEVQSFADWFIKQPHKHKVLIAGNHDLSLEAPELFDKKLQHPGNQKRD